MSSARRFERAVTLVILLWAAVLAAAFLFGCQANACGDGTGPGLRDAGQRAASGARR